MKEKYIIYAEKMLTDTNGYSYFWGAGTGAGIPSPSTETCNIEEGLRRSNVQLFQDRDAVIKLATNLQRNYDCYKGTKNYHRIYVICVSQDSLGGIDMVSMETVGGIK